MRSRGKAMSRGKGPGKNSLTRKLNIALAEGAEITVEWITTVVIKAKREWIVGFEKFHDHLSVLLKNRGFNFSKDMDIVLKNCWFANA